MHALVSISSPDDEVVADHLWTLGAVGVEYRGEATIGAFDNLNNARRAAAHYGVEVTPVSDDTGLDAWREHAELIDAGPFSVRAPWLDPGSGIDLVIDPGHAFGSGSHPSTRLALRLLADFCQPDLRVVDVGTGSGVLAVAAAKLGATVVAIDNDPAAATAVAANAETNEASDNVTFRLAPAQATTLDADLALINVTIDIHELLASSVNASVVGHLIVAGVLNGEQVDRCATLYQRPVVTKVTEGEWAGALLGPRAER